MVKAPIGILLRKRSEIMGYKEFSKKLSNSKGYSIFLIIIGVLTLVTGLGVIWSVLIGIFAIALGSYSLYKISKKPKPV